MEHSKIVSFIEELKSNKEVYERGVVDSENVPPSWIAGAIYSYVIEKLEEMAETS